MSKSNEKIFYKYKSCDGQETDNSSDFYRVLDSLEKKYLYLSRPSQLNDPEDCKVQIKFNASNEDLQNWILQHPSVGKITVPSFRKLKDTAKFQLDMRDSIKTEKEHLHIFSLTTDNNNNKMWNDYAKNYSGVCLGFKTEKLNKPYDNYFIEVSDTILNKPYISQNNVYFNFGGKYYLVLLKVKYDTQKFVTYEYFKSWKTNENDPIKESFVHKNKSIWSYEDESRLMIIDEVRPRENNFIDLKIDYPDSLLAEVWFGHNIDPQKRQRILDLLKAEYSNFANISIGDI